MRVRLDRSALAYLAEKALAGFFFGREDALRLLAETFLTARALALRGGNGT
jgi:hypothetical protein